jgi:hypothetical protein
LILQEETMRLLKDNLLPASKQQTLRQRHRMMHNLQDDNYSFRLPRPFRRNLRYFAAQIGGVFGGLAE